MKGRLKCFVMVFQTTSLLINLLVYICPRHLRWSANIARLIDGIRPARSSIFTHNAVFAFRTQIQFYSIFNGLMVHLILVGIKIVHIANQSDGMFPTPDVFFQLR